MPMPKPHKGEPESEFVSRFMSDPAMVREYPDEKQRVAVAYSAFGEKVKDEATCFDGVVCDVQTMPTKREKTPEGFLIIRDCRMAKPGIMLYRGAEVGHPEPDRIVRVYRPERELLSQSVFDTFKSKPVTVRHPGLVDASNARHHMVGMSKDDIRRDADGFMTGSIVVTDDESISAVEANKIGELSLGYTARFHIQSGTTPTGEPYDVLMTNISGNHIALVERGRNGRECRVSDAETTKQGTATMERTIVLDGISYTVSAQAADIIEKLEKRVADSEAKHNKAVADHDSAISALKKECETLTAQRDAAKAEKLTQDQLEAKVAERVALIDNARKIVADYDATGKTEAQVYADVCTKSGITVQDRSPEYIKARFDILVEEAGKQSTRSALPKTVEDSKTVSTKSASEMARERRWKKEEGK